jgi:flagellar motor switch protein FliN/FliY
MTMTTEEALLELGGSTADAVLRVLLSIAPDAAEKGAVSVVQSSGTPMQALAFPAVAANVSYVDGVTGGNVFVITRLGARKLAATMMMQEPPAEDHEGELDEIELSAVGEAMNQMMAAAAGATGKVLGQEVEISVPTTHMFEKAATAEGAFPKTPHATTAAFTVLGEPCRLIQLVPNAFVVRMTRALADRNAEQRGGNLSDGEPILSAESIRDIRVRVGAELGRATLPLAKAVGLGTGAVVELDRAPNDPIDLYVNGRRFATGRLLLVDQTEWAVHIEHVLDPDAAYATSHEGGF